MNLIVEIGFDVRNDNNWTFKNLQSGSFHVNR